MNKNNESIFTLSLSTLGVVYGDIGTSPLYTLKECFHGVENIPATPTNVLGVVSLIFWSIILVVCLKYVILIMRADNNGEGGILALTAIALRKASPALAATITISGIFGAALFFGDGIITPAISVLSALEGLNIATPIFAAYIMPLAIGILILLFLLQKQGTHKVGQLFGPIMGVWFVCIGLLGAVQIAYYPAILKAINPMYAIYFFYTSGFEGFVVLGVAFLALTGAEALYADMGHFGKTAIRYSWFYLVLPSLVLNYFGQGVVLLTNPAAVKNPFYHLVPSWGLYPLVILATIATIIASQSVISGTFSLARQAVQLGYFPRLRITHTSAKEIGQVYLPQINRWMMIGVILLVLQFQTSDALAAAYGVSVSGIMVTTLALIILVAREFWHWSWLSITLVFGSLLLIDLSFFCSNLLKIFDGGWISLAVALVVYITMSTWRAGRKALLQQAQRSALSVHALIKMLPTHPIQRVPGTAIFMSSNNNFVPYSLKTNLKYNKILHERVLLLSIVIKDVPYVAKNDRIHLEELGHQVYRVTAKYGFKQQPNMLLILEQITNKGLTLPPAEVIFFLSRGVPVIGNHPSLPRWREKLFVYLARNAASATEFFTIPYQRIVELRIPFKV